MIHGAISGYGLLLAVDGVSRLLRREQIQLFQSFAERPRALLFCLVVSTQVDALLNDGRDLAILEQTGLPFLADHVGVPVHDHGITVFRGGCEGERIAAQVSGHVTGNSPVAGFVHEQVVAVEQAGDGERDGIFALGEYDGPVLLRAAELTHDDGDCARLASEVEGALAHTQSQMPVILFRQQLRAPVEQHVPRDRVGGGRWSTGICHGARLVEMPPLF